MRRITEIRRYRKSNNLRAHKKNTTEEINEIEWER